MEDAKNCLTEAAALVGGDRGDTYGHPADDFGKVTGAANALGINPLSGPLHHALYMVLVKLSRLVETPDHHDSIVDVCGYMRTYEMVLGRREAENHELHIEAYKTASETLSRKNFEEWRKQHGYTSDP